MTSHVYILVSQKGTRLKIGKANNIISRAKQFNAKSIDFNQSLGLQVVDAKTANSLERVMHKTFAKWRMSRDDVLKDGGRSEGSTEWFSIDCRPHVTDYLALTGKWLDFQIITGKDLQDELERRMQQVLTPAAAPVLTSEELRQKEQKWKALEEVLKEKQEKVWQEIRAFYDDAKNQCDLLLCKRSTSVLSGKRVMTLITKNDALFHLFEQHVYRLNLIRFPKSKPGLGGEDWSEQWSVVIPSYLPFSWGPCGEYKVLHFHVDFQYYMTIDRKYETPKIIQDAQSAYELFDACIKEIEGWDGDVSNETEEKANSIMKLRNDVVQSA